MSGKKVTLIIRFKDSGGWRRLPAARGANGRLKPGAALIDGKPVQVQQYAYEVRYYQDRAVRFIPAGTNCNDAETLRRKIETQNSAQAVAEKAGLKIESTPDRRTLKKSAADYIIDARGRGASEAALQARIVTEGFLRTIHKTYVDEINRADVLRYREALRKSGNGERTIHNKSARLASWLVFAGMAKDELPPLPRFEKKLPTVYTPDEITSILAAAGPYMHLAISIALKCGLRDQELIHLEWSDIDASAKTLRVQGKPRWGFAVKDSEQREVPLADGLLAELAAWHKGHLGQGLILPTQKGRPNGHLLRTLKRLAGSNGLGCGHCAGCNGPYRECENWTLHKFRRTYCTTLLRNGIDLRTVQALMGHANLASTMRYLRPAEGDGLRAKVNAIQWE